MGMPSGIGVIDLMLQIPAGDNTAWYEFMKPLLMDQESRHQFKMPAQYMFKNIPHVGQQDDYIKYTVEQMDKWGIERAMLSIAEDKPVTLEAVRRYPDRFFPSANVKDRKSVV